MAIRDKDTIKNSIIADIPDNNAGLISAQDIRDNMVDTVDSINTIVASGDVDSTYPFSGSNVRAKKNDAGQFGVFIPESGVQFQDGKTQIYAYEGPEGIDHTKLANLTADSHPQYLNVTGVAAASYMQGGLPLDTHWIGVSGYDDRGIRFKKVNDVRDDVHVGASGNVLFTTDGSRADTFKGAAKAWIVFKGSGTVGETAGAATPGYQTPVVYSSYNVSGINYIARGQYKITFASGTFQNNYYAAVGNSNAIASSTAYASHAATDFDVNTVGIVSRIGDDASSLRSCTFYVKSDDNEYVDAALNDLVIYGLGSGTTPDSTPTINPS
tara:strand:- start:191 stop:1168 length:978 start_codon:yes stop_codon:yes gene_type:complete